MNDLLLLRQAIEGNRLTHDLSSTKYLDPLVTLFTNTDYRKVAGSSPVARMARRRVGRVIAT
jgi:hypothetical protein